MVECKLLSKVIKEKSYYELSKYNIGYRDFVDQKSAYKFIKDYVREFGCTPSYEAVVSECEEFDYIDDVADSIGYLCKTLKRNRARREAFDLLQNKATEKFNNLKGDEFIKWLVEESTKIQQVTDTSALKGTNWAINGEERKNNYMERKNLESVIIPTPYNTLNKGLGGGSLGGDYVLIMAFTNVGKSWLACQFGVTAWANGKDVLHYSPEENTIKTLSRLDTVCGHFNNTQLKRGALSNEGAYFDYLTQFKEGNHGYILKTMEDLPKGLSVETIEADLQAHPTTKMVVLDGLNLMNGIGGNDRENLTHNSRRIRQLSNMYNVVFVVTHQVSKEGMKDSQSYDEDGIRIVSPPKLDGYSGAIATIQDPTTVLTYDQYDGLGKLLVAKTREDNKGDEIELQADYNNGYITEVEKVDFI